MLAKSRRLSSDRFSAVAIARRRGGSASSTAGAVRPISTTALAVAVSAERPKPAGTRRFNASTAAGMPIARLTSAAMDRAWTYSRGGASARTSNADSHSRSDCVLQSDQSTLMVKKTATVRLAVAMASLNEVRLVPSVRRRPVRALVQGVPDNKGGENPPEERVIPRQQPCAANPEPLVSVQQPRRREHDASRRYECGRRAQALEPDVQPDRRRASS